MEYFVDIKLRSRRLLTRRMLLAVAEIGGVATGKIGGRRLETTLTVTADDAEYAEACVLNFIRRHLPSEFEVIEARAIAAADLRAHCHHSGTLPSSLIRPAG
ncbi:MAG TPA: hypothetical protein VJM31_00885 [Vicinamibacterales bacterium]|nr:hypothetical protein [Vicinamibacterales bacterium]